MSVIKKAGVTGFLLPGLLMGMTACTTTSPYLYQGALAGGAVGATAGVLIDHHNRWRGAVVGGALGSALGAATTEIASRSAYQATSSGRSGTYQGDGRWHSPGGYHRW